MTHNNERHLRTASTQMGVALRALAMKGNQTNYIESVSGSRSKKCQNMPIIKLTFWKDRDNSYAVLDAVGVGVGKGDMKNATKSNVKRNMRLALLTTQSSKTKNTVETLADCTQGRRSRVSSVKALLWVYDAICKRNLLPRVRPFFNITSKFIRELSKLISTLQFFGDSLPLNNSTSCTTLRSVRGK